MFDEEEAGEAYREEVLTRHSSQEYVKKVIGLGKYPAR
jgi:hypothetical protein